MKSEHSFTDKCLSTTQRLSSDIITTLPQTIVDTILCLLPIKEAARTSILSREWRYKWTKIPKLVFSTPSGDQMMETRKLFYAIHQVMLLHNDPIHEFTLRIEHDVNSFSKFGYDFYEVDQIILHLSRYHKVKNLTLRFDEFGGDGATYGLPFSIFSLHHLVDLALSWCAIDHQPTFSGFRNLTTLFLHCVRISRKTLLHLLSNCPSLKSFSLVSNLLLILLGFGHLSKQ
ncbi:F-box/FBD/LRR-repeat protein At1g13570-like [Bidens hawaiensis]|uniref:F-box/FBD/LRR-repeat protein At1g13570-like n=1 Tax=Bidens hawaiensis TaxID=980011 RepID=UPI00404B74C5